MLPFAICMNAIPPSFFWKVSFFESGTTLNNTSWQARKPRGHGLQEMRLSWPPKCRLLAVHESKTKKQNKVQEVKIEVSRMLRFKNQTVVPVVNQRDLNYGSAKTRRILSAEKVTKKWLLGIGTSDFRGIAWTACTACPTGFGSWWMWITHDISNKQPRLFTYSLLKGWIMNSRKSAAKDDTKSCLCPSSLAPRTVGPPFVAPLAQCAAWTPLDVNHTGSAFVRFLAG